MAILAGETYHTYNQGNNHERLFYQRDDYLLFLDLTKEYVLPNCHILAYCLMPNHFHFLIHATEKSARNKKIGSINSTELTNGFRLLQSSYAHYLNNRINRSGSLFRQKAKFKPVITDDIDYGLTAFHYIHQNPFKAGLVTKLEDWSYSSFRDFSRIKMDSICHKTLAISLLDLKEENFLEDSYKMIDEDEVKKIFF